MNVYLSCIIGLTVLCARPGHAAYSFLSLGDWGGHALETPEYQTTSMAVAKQLLSTANVDDAAFLVNTADSFYWCGLMNTSDFQIKADWLVPYGSNNMTW